MRIIRKSLALFLSSLCLILIKMSTVYCQDKLSSDVDANDKFTVRVTKESFTDFSDSLIIPYTNEKISLNQIFFSNPNFITGKIQNQEILSLARKRQDVQLSSSNVEIKDNESNPNIYKINLTSIKNNKSDTTPTIQNSQKQSSSIAAITINGGSVPDTKKLISESRQLIKKGNYTKADTILNNIVSNTKTNSWLLAEIAGIYEQNKNYTKASYIYDKAIKINPNRIELLYSYALCLLKNNQINKAETILNRVIIINPDFMLAYYNLGNIYFKKGNYYSALKAFNRSIALNPLSSDAYFNIGIILEGLSYKNLASKYYTKCLEIKPGDYQAQKGLERLRKV